MCQRGTTTRRSREWKKMTDSDTAPDGVHLVRLQALAKSPGTRRVVADYDINNPLKGASRSD